MAVFLVETLGLALVTKMGPNQPRASHTVSNRQVLRKKRFFFVSERSGSRYSKRYVCTFFRAKNRMSDLLYEYVQK